jgi:ABC-type transporter MlaC component
MMRKKPMRRQLWSISLILAVAWGWTIPAWAESPAAYVRSILDKVMGLQNDASPCQQSRASAIYGIIEPSFDFAMMAKHSLGPTYDSLSEGQRQDFTRTFSHLCRDSSTRLGLNFLKKENIQYGQERQEGDKSEVATPIVRPNENIPVTYFRHTTPQGWIL